MAEGYRNRDQYRPMGLHGLGRTLHYAYVDNCTSAAYYYYYYYHYYYYNRFMVLWILSGTTRV